jgi:hypothetical protein
MIGIDDFIAYVEIAVDADHEETPASAGHLRNNTLLFYPTRSSKGNPEAGFGSEDRNSLQL